MPGEFTSRFDKEILKSALAEQQKKQQEQEKEKTEQDRIDSEIKEIGKILDRRAGFIKDRFANASVDKVDYTGFKFTFAKAEGKREASFFVRARLNDSKMAILVESNYEIPASSVKEYDYVSLPIQKIDREKAQRFIESKLLDFARTYVG